MNLMIENPDFDGTVKRGAATCPCCGYTTPITRVREQLKTRRGGANDARLFCVVTKRETEPGRFYRLPTEHDISAIRKAISELERRKTTHKGPLSIVPDEAISVVGSYRIIKMLLYGATTWGDIFSPRQALALAELSSLVKSVAEYVSKSESPELAIPVQTCLAFVTDKMADKASSLCRWKATAEYMGGNTFGRQALPMMWDFCEASVLGEVTGDIASEVEWVEKVLQNISLSVCGFGHTEEASATSHPLPDDSASAYITDPPYYHAISYATLSDFFYTWLRRMLSSAYPELFRLIETQKHNEIIVDLPHALNTAQKDITFYENELCKAFSEGRRILRPDGIGTIVFASKTTASWEAILKALVDAGWIITGSWPIDTEMESRIAAQGQARLASSVHLVCRPRENPDGSVQTDEIGDWREVLQELPHRIHKWMPRLANEGVVGADAIFACLGPALEIFSRYSHVEKTSGEIVTLREYLEQIWAAVSKEALSMIFTGADASGFEEDARLTAMWLWTLKTGDVNGDNGKDEEEDTDEDEASSKKSKLTGFSLEFDAARKIAQGLGAHLESLDHLVAVQGETATLLPVAARTRYLFGKEASEGPRPKPKKKDPQLKLDFDGEIKKIEEESGTWGGEFKARAGSTTLDQLHQCMILFASNRAEALKRLIVEDGVGRNPLFWRLAQALSALYPSSSDEKRWVDGVLARKKGLGF